MKPLFVMGVHRSGTTWLANALCNHSQIWGVQSQKHFGIVESWFFSHMDGRVADIRDVSNYRSLIGDFSETEFFRATGVTRSILEDLNPEDYGDFFRQFMIRAASKGAIRSRLRYWLEKTPVHTLYLDQLTGYFPEARFVAVQRSLQGVLLSTLTSGHANGRESVSAPSLRVAHAVLHWHKYHSYLQHFIGKYPDRFWIGRYEDLVERPATQFRECLDFLNLGWEAAVLEQRFEPNTSFEQARPVRLSEQSQRVATVASILARLVSYRGYRLHEHLRRPRNQEPIPFLNTR